MSGPGAGRVRTAVVGSLPQPEWLVDRALLRKHMAPRVRVKDIWRIPERFLEEAQDDATVVAIRVQEAAGIDIITDGEIRRESYSNRFANALGGIDHERNGEIIGRTGNRIPVPRVTGPIERLQPVEVRDVAFLRANTDRTIKITLPGPFTMTQQAVNEHYPSQSALALAFADAVNAEVRDLFAAGADIVQLDEPWLQARSGPAREYGLAAINRALEGVTGTTALHLCFGYADIVKDKPAQYAFLTELRDSLVEQISIEAAQPGLDLAVLADLLPKTLMVGVLDLGDPAVESPALVAERIHAALKYVSADRLIATPDCGMKYMPREIAEAKLRALGEGAARVNAEL